MPKYSNKKSKQVNRMQTFSSANATLKIISMPCKRHVELQYNIN